MASCLCREVHDPHLVVLTGGPGAGKTAALELVRRSLCPHVRVLPEAASIVFGGGFPREQEPPGRRAAQRAIFHVQRQLEVAALAHNPAIVLCDRGTLDGLAYWPGPVQDFWAGTDTSQAEELGRYHAVIHLRTPTSNQGYNHQNPLRVESAAGAADIDERILRIWETHPQRFVIPPAESFLDKVASVVDVLRGQLPDCCAQHGAPGPAQQACEGSPPASP